MLAGSTALDLAIYDLTGRVFHHKVVVGHVGKPQTAGMDEVIGWTKVGYKFIIHISDLQLVCGVLTDNIDRFGSANVDSLTTSCERDKRAGSTAV